MQLAARIPHRHGFGLLEVEVPLTEHKDYTSMAELEEAMAAYFQVNMPYALSEYTVLSCFGVINTKSLIWRLALPGHQGYSPKHWDKQFEKLKGAA